MSMCEAVTGTSSNCCYRSISTYYTVVSTTTTSTTTTTLYPCTDSDGGMNYYLKGTTSGNYAGSATKEYRVETDICYGSQLNEGYCLPDGYMSITATNCANGCSNGACLSATTTTTTSTTVPTTTVLPYFLFEASASPTMPSLTGIDHSHMAIGDADNDGTKEIVYAYNELIVYRDTGSSLVQEAMLDIPNSARPSPLIEDVDGDGQNEIVFVVVYLVSGTQYNARLYVVRHSGSSITIEATYETAAPTNTPITPTIDDLDGDGQKEIIFYTSQNNMSILRHTGSLLQLETTYNSGTIDDVTIPSHNLDGDSQKEIVFASGIGPIKILRHTGSSIVSEATYTPGSFFIGASCPAVGNLDSDPDTEIFLSDSSSGYYVLRHTGSSIVQESVYSPSNAARTSTAAADFDNDGSMEIVVSGVGTGTAYNRLKVFRHTGSSLVQEAEMTVTNWDYNPVAADIDNDGTIEIIRASRDGYLYSLNHTGASLIVEGSYYLGAPAIFSPLIDDIDGDGWVEIVTATSAGIRVIQAGVKRAASYSSWPVVMRNLARTGYQPK